MGISSHLPSTAQNGMNSLWSFTPKIVLQDAHLPTLSLSTVAQGMLQVAAPSKGHIVIFLEIAFLGRVQYTNSPFSNASAWARIQLSGRVLPNRQGPRFEPQQHIKQTWYCKHVILALGGGNGRIGSSKSSSARPQV